MEIKDIKNPYNSPVYYKGSTDSTMSDMAQLKNPEHGTVIFTGFQKRGRGRGTGRSWTSEPGKNLLFTIALDPGRIAHPLVRAPLICGLALSSFLEVKYKIKAFLKWPNDILVNVKKISGILCEYRKGMILAGIGINCLEENFPEELKFKSTSLSLEGISNCRPESVLEDFLPELKNFMEMKQWKEKALKDLYGFGEALEIFEGSSDDPRKKRVRITGLTDDGFLIVDDLDSGSEKIISTGEIRFADFV